MATRQVFVDHQRAIRPNEGNDTILQEWNAKSRHQKTEWVAILRAANAARDTAHARTLVLGDAIDELVGRYANNELNRRNSYLRFIQDAVNLARNLHNAIDLWNAAETAWRELERVDRAHAGTHPDSIADDQTRAADMRESGESLNDDSVYIRAMSLRPPIPADQDGVRVQPYEWTAHDNDSWSRRKKYLAHGTHVAAQNLGLEDSQPGQWVPWATDDGGMSNGGLWLQFDGHNQVVDRVYRKVTFMTEFEWRDPARWENDIREPGLKVPLELACHHKMTYMRAPGIVRLKRDNYHPDSVDHATETYRVYTEWCRHGTLAGIIDLHVGQNAPIPEPFIWSVAESICEAGMAMSDHGGMPGFGSGQTVHQDIKPLNLFMSGPRRDGQYPDYPQALLGDFGLAFKTRTPDPNNPSWYRGWGTQGFKAPEQRLWIDQVTGDFCFGLMTRNWDPPEPFYLGDGMNDDTLRLRTAVRNRYSTHLRHMIETCLLWDHTQRQNFRYWHGYIEFYTDGNRIAPANEDSDLSRQMRAGTVQGPARAQQMPRYSPDKYQLGMARAAAAAALLA